LPILFIDALAAAGAVAVIFTAGFVFALALCRAAAQGDAYLDHQERDL
jgi:hypothetical protein